MAKWIHWCRVILETYELESNTTSFYTSHYRVKISIFLLSDWIRNSSIYTKLCKWLIDQV